MSGKPTGILPHLYMPNGHKECSDCGHPRTTSWHLPHPPHAYTTIGDGLCVACGFAEAEVGWHGQQDDDDKPKKRRTITMAASGFDPRQPRWLWQGRMALGSLTILAGREGVGKSTLAYWIAAAVTRGDLSGEHYGRPAPVLVAATEDSWEYTIVPRLMAADADLDLVLRVMVATETGRTAELDLPADVEILGQTIAETGAAMLMLDPLSSRLSGALDTHRDAEVRQALEPLVATLERHGTAGLGLMHFNKSGSDDPLNALMGSRAFGAVSRSVLAVVKDPEDDTGRRRLFGIAKNNLALDTVPLRAFTIQPAQIPTSDGPADTSAIAWAEDIDGTISDAMRRNGEPSDRGAVDEAADWLSDYLEIQGGVADSAAVKKAGHAAGHSDMAIRRARHKLGVVAQSYGYPRRTTWRIDGE